MVSFVLCLPMEYKYGIIDFCTGRLNELWLSVSSTESPWQPLDTTGKYFLYDKFANSSQISLSEKVNIYKSITSDGSWYRVQYIFQ